MIKLFIIYIYYLYNPLIQQFNTDYRKERVKYQTNLLVTKQFKHH